MKKKLTAAVLAGILVLSGCGESAEVAVTPTPELIAPISVKEEVAVAQRRDIYTVSSFPAKIIPHIEEAVFEKGGSFGNFYVEIGDEVLEGQTIASLDVGGQEYSYRSLVDRYNSVLGTNEYNNRLAEIDIEIAKLKGLDTTKLEMDLRHKKEIQVLEEEPLLAKIAQARSGLDANTVKAPISGKVVALANLWGYAAVSENTAAVAIADESKYVVSCEYINTTKLGKAERIYALINGKEYDVEYNPTAEDKLTYWQLNKSTMQSTFNLLGVGAEDQIKIGDYAMICMVSDYRSQVISIPIGAVYKDKSVRYVYVLKNGSRMRVNVTLGVSGSAYVEVLEGLEEGDCVYVQN